MQGTELLILTMNSRFVVYVNAKRFSADGLEKKMLKDRANAKLLAILVFSVYQASLATTNWQQIF